MNLTKEQQQEADEATWQSLQRHVPRGEEALEILQEAYQSTMFEGGKGGRTMSEDAYYKLQKFFDHDRY